MKHICTALVVKKCAPHYVDSCREESITVGIVYVVAYSVLDFQNYT